MAPCNLEEALEIVLLAFPTQHLDLVRKLDSQLEGNLRTIAGPQAKRLDPDIFIKEEIQKVTIDGLLSVMQAQPTDLVSSFTVKGSK